MTSSMMANTTQDQQNIVGDNSTGSEEAPESEEFEDSHEHLDNTEDGDGELAVDSSSTNVVQENHVEVKETRTDEDGGSGQRDDAGGGEGDGDGDGDVGEVPVECDGDGENEGDDEGDGGGGGGEVVESAEDRADDSRGSADLKEGEDVADADADADVDDDEEDDEEGDIDDGEENPDQQADAKSEKPLDHDQDRRNPQYIPKGGAFYEHDNRTSSEDVENKDPQDVEKKKKVWKESKESERWLHDWYKESEQQPKTKAEIIEAYGYDIRKEEAPPRARRRRKYGRGPDKYDRNWEDEQAYMVKQNVGGRRGKKKSFGKEEFPPLPNNKNESSSVTTTGSTASPGNLEKTPPKSPARKRGEDESSPRKPQRMGNSHDKSGPGPQPTHHSSGRSEYVNNSRTDQHVHNNRNEYGGPRNGTAIISNSSKRPGPGPNRKPGPGPGPRDDGQKPPFKQFEKTKWKTTSFKRGKDADVLKPNKSKMSNQDESQTPRSVESNKSYSTESDVGHITDGFVQMTFHNKHSNMRDTRQDSSEIAEQEMDNSANRLNPKRYSKNRKGFTGYFPPEEIAEINPLEMKQLQQDQQQKSQHVNLPHQPLNIQNVMRRYPGTYNGNPGYITSRPIITGIPQQGMSPQGLQQTLSPQGIPQQALSPQVPGLQAIELQQGPIPPQANFVPPMYFDIDSHYGASEMMGPYAGYAPYSASQPGEMYQTSGGTTYYHTECQNSNRAPPARREKAVIPILPPP